MNRTVLKVAGESGMGLDSVGDIIARSLKFLGFYVHSDREYPSLIKGGHSNMQIDFGLGPIRALSTQVDLVMALDRAGLVEYLKVVKPGGVLVHGYERHDRIKDLDKIATERGVKLLYLPARTIAHQLGGNEMMVNMVLLGLLWRILGLPLEPLEKEVEKRYGKRPKILEIDLKCVRHAYNTDEIETPKYTLTLPAEKPDKILLDGNLAITLGAIHAGVRAYYAYPMSPSTSILTYMANYSHKTGMLVKQIEDEISVAQMTLGSMHMGTRALCATSGGGFDLMTETVSLAGMIETPWVCVVVQRPGPATGLPTWTGQGDLNLAIHAGHGEFSRCVIAASDPTSCFELIQHALNIAEQYQIPVIVLSEKVIAESETMVDPFPLNTLPIKRGLVTDKADLENLKSTDRYALTDSGISQRWLPGTSPAYYYANSDEHQEDGVLTEEGDAAEAMLKKRLRKLNTLKANVPAPKIFGPEKADLSFVTWGSSLSALRDAMPLLEQEGITFNVLHYEYLWPLREDALKDFAAKNPNLVIMEGNATGQFKELAEAKAGIKFMHQFLKANGRPFFVEDVLEFVKTHTV